MNHDILHCDGLNCKLRDNCHRYLAHLEAQKNYDLAIRLWGDNEKEE